MSLRWAPIAAVLIAFAGCGNNKDFDGDSAKTILETKPFSLDSEQVTLSQKALDCGTQAELWDAPVQVSQDRSTARLSPQAKSLGFSDDVVIEPNSYHQPYAQVRGAFQLQMIDDAPAIRDGEESGTKLVTAKAGVKIPHACFPDPLPIMAVNKGKFREDSPASFLFRSAENGWHLEKLVH
jgi:hypothetical protein